MSRQVSVTGPGFVLPLGLQSIPWPGLWLASVQVTCTPGWVMQSPLKGQAHSSASLRCAMVSAFGNAQESLSTRSVSVCALKEQPMLLPSHFMG